MNDSINQFWNERVAVGEHAGTNDFIMKQLELKEIMARVPEGAYVLDAGSGNGETLLRLAREKSCTGLGLDFAEKLVAYANEQARERNLDRQAMFARADVLDLPDDLGEFDVVISERCMINLANSDEQKKAFDALRQRTRPGGMFLMFENSLQGLAENNRWRAMLGVKAMQAPWHNHYFDEDEVARWESPDFGLEGLFHFASTYHFLSRVVYARLAQDSGEELVYDSPINMLAQELMPMGKLGPTKLWVWKRS